MPGYYRNHHSDLRKPSPKEKFKLHMEENWPAYLGIAVASGATFGLTVRAIDKNYASIPLSQLQSLTKDGTVGAMELSFGKFHVVPDSLVTIN